MTEGKHSKVVKVQQSMPLSQSIEREHKKLKELETIKEEQPKEQEQACRHTSLEQRTRSSKRPGAHQVRGLAGNGSEIHINVIPVVRYHGVENEDNGDLPTLPARVVFSDGERLHDEPNDEDLQQRRRKQQLCKFLGTQAILLAALGVALVFVFGPGSSRHEMSQVPSSSPSSESPPTQSSPTRTIQPTKRSPLPVSTPPALTSPPSFVTGIIPQPEASHPIEKAELIQLIKTKLPSTRFDNASSPQSLALEWMLSDSYLANVFGIGQNRLLQRFALATLWYATGGNTTWSMARTAGWLSPTTECDWGNGDLQCTPESFVHTIHLFDDGMVGSIPSELALLSTVSNLLLFLNDLEGSLPTELGLMEALVGLNIGGNKVSGSVPTELFGLDELDGLFLEGNNLSGSIPTELGQSSALSWLVLGSNNLTGTLPSEVGLLTGLTYIDLSGNDLTGRIPSELDLTRLRHMDLSGTQLSGFVEA